MPIPINSNKKFDFEELFFEKNCDIDNIITNFFIKYNEYIKGDTEYITFKIKKLIDEDRKILTEMNGNGQDILNRIGKISYIKHDVDPEKNNGKSYYIYCINSFI
jgi:negative regulator of sigma E activity